MKMLTPSQVLFENVTAQYPRINQTCRFDNMDNKTVPCRPERSGAAYEVSFNMTNEDATEFLKKCDEVAKLQQQTQSASGAAHVLPMQRTGQWATAKDQAKGCLQWRGHKATPAKRCKQKHATSELSLTSGGKINVWGQLFAYNTGLYLVLGLGCAACEYRTNKRVQAILLAQLKVTRQQSKRMIPLACHLLSQARHELHPRMAS